MLLYEYQVRDAFDRVVEYAENLREKFAERRPVEELLRDASNLAVMYEDLVKILPEEVKVTGNFGRHLGWMKQRLTEDRPDLCQGDISDICDLDIPALEKAFRDWCAKPAHYDPELAAKIGGLVLQREYDSAIRRAFVILKSRIVRSFNTPANLDGVELVNHVFGGKGILVSVVADADRQAYRDLLAGLYGVFRNKYSHNDVQVEWYEFEAAASAVNYALKEVDKLRLMLLDVSKLPR